MPKGSWKKCVGSARLRLRTKRAAARPRRTRNAAGRSSASILPKRDDYRDNPVRLEIVEAPFPDVSGHVFDPERTRAEWESPHRRTFLIPVIDLAIAPGKNRIAVGEIRQVAAMFVISPRVTAPIRAARRV